MADHYARGFRSAAAAGKRLLHDMADQLDHRTQEDAFAGKAPPMVVQKLRLAAQRVGALEPPGRTAGSGIPITKAKDQ